jgi:hypothetical protein
MWNGRWRQAAKRMHTIYDAAKKSLEGAAPCWLKKGGESATERQLRGTTVGEII